MATARTTRIGRPPGSRREDTVARLLAAAQDHFGRHGFAGARMVEIAKDAGITHSAVYGYFASKNELYDAAVQAALDRLIPEYLQGISGAATLQEQLGALFSGDTAQLNFSRRAVRVGRGGRQARANGNHQRLTNLLKRLGSPAAVFSW